MKVSQIVLGKVSHLGKKRRNNTHSNPYVESKQGQCKMSSVFKLGGKWGENQQVPQSSARVTTSKKCGPEGAAISLWFKLDVCGTGGMITSRSVGATTGLQLNCDADVLR